MEIKYWYLFTIISLALVVLFVLTRKPDPVDTSPYQEKIDSLNRNIATYQHQIDSLQKAAARIPDTIRVIEKVVERIPTAVELLPPDELLRTWDTLTGSVTTSQLTHDSLAITPLPAIRAGTVALMQVPHLKQQINLYVNLTTNQANQLALKDSIIDDQGNIIHLQDVENADLQQSLSSAEKDLKVWKWIAGGSTTALFFALILR